MSPTFPIRSLLVLCEANHCRAPMAEALLRAALGSGFEVASAGLAALEGAPPDAEVERLMRARGLDISRHRGRQFTPDLARQADLILVMEGQHKEWCARVSPASRGRIFLLGHWLSDPPTDIADPFCQGPEVYRQVAEEIQLAVSTWVPHLLSQRRLA